ncbi:MAG: N-acetylmuramoyl-L-alanine amidase [Salinisphaera sp.]|jgi:N-acetylmuramoyl-L-alanine amidase|nr:N-acetylmuramoyl-L-alanine amidase [Salinisphaera sp.]
MWQSLGALGMFLLAASFSLVATAAPAVIDRIRVTTSGTATQVMFQGTALPSFKYFQLSAPPRGVIDFQGARASRGVEDVSGGAVDGIRLARHADGRLRAVLELHPGAHLVQVSAKGSDRVVAHINGGASSQSSGRRTAPGSGGAHHSSAPSTASSADPGVPQAVYRAAAENGPIVVVIDPGHGGHDSGTVAASGLQEKTVALAIAKRLYARLKATKSIHPVLTRDDDTFVTLRQRVRIAQEHHANLFVSIHQNAYPASTSVDGGTCYVLSQHGATDAKTAQLAHFENSADRNVAGVQFSDTDHTLNAVLTDLYQNASINDAEDLADSIITHFGQVGPLYRRKPPRANFAVLRDPMIPSVLCETAFLSNPTQARKLASSNFRNQLADAMFNGIMTYFREHPPERLQATGSGRTYTVKSGDTLSEIAANSGLSMQAIMDVNHLHSHRLRIGQRLEIPAADMSSGG